MTKSMLAGFLALSAALLPRGAAAAVIAPAPAALATPGLVQAAQVFCGPYGCGPIWPGPRDDRWSWAPSGHVYRPACPTDYYYACRRGPLGYRQCACWPYWKW